MITDEVKDSVASFYTHFTFHCDAKEIVEANNREE